MGFPIYVVDAFTEHEFHGNPAAVCFCNETATPGWMQKVAAEMNLAETAFLVEREGMWGLRWFSPNREVELCGHATLASAHALKEIGRLEKGATVWFSTVSGLLSAKLVGSAIELDFPSEPPQPAAAPNALTQALVIPARNVGRNRFDYLVELANEDEVRDIAPDIGLLRSVEMRGVIVTARSNEEDYDFVSRFFAPRYGIDEDPATGSAHCCLGPYWRERLHKDEMVGRQLSARGGVIRVRVEGERVALIGHAVTTLRGELIASRA